MTLNTVIDSSTMKSMRFGAICTGPAEFTKTDLQPAMPTTVSSWGKAFRAAVGGVMLMVPSVLSAENSSASTTQMRDAHGTLRQAWQELAVHLGKRNTELDELREKIIASLTAQNLPDTRWRFERACEDLIYAFTNGDDGREFATVEGQLRLHRETTELLDSYSQYISADANRPEHLVQADRDALISANDKRTRAEERYADVLLTDETGRRLRMYPEELADDPTLTPDAYLDLLAKRLKSPADLAMFLRLFFKYEIDTDDVTQPLRKGTWSNNADYWQTPGETLARVENGKMLGDCDDHTLFCDALLARMGKYPVTIYLPGNSGAHVTTIWLEERNGRFIVCEMGTDGWYENGEQRIKAAFKDGVESEIPGTLTGHPTKEAAIRAALEHFRATDLLLTNFDAHNPQIRTPMQRWKPNQRISERIESISMNELVTLLWPPAPEPMFTAEAEAPPPPPE